MSDEKPSSPQPEIIEDPSPAKEDVQEEISEIIPSECKQVYDEVVTTHSNQPSRKHGKKISPVKEISPPKDTNY
jgi:hypothetical protein